MEEKSKNDFWISRITSTSNSFIRNLHTVCFIIKPVYQKLPVSFVCSHIRTCHRLCPFPKTYPGSSSIMYGTSSYPGPNTLSFGASSCRGSSDFLSGVSCYPVTSCPVAPTIQDILSGALSCPGSSSDLFGYPSPIKSMPKSISRPPRVLNPACILPTKLYPVPLSRAPCPPLPSLLRFWSDSQEAKPGTQVAGCLTRLAGATARPHRPRPL